MFAHDKNSSQSNVSQGQDGVGQALMAALSEVDPRPEKIFRCPNEGCGKVFRSSPGYRYHLRSHASDPRPHRCECCSKKFKSANGLKYHLRKAHQIEPVLAKDKHALKLEKSDRPSPTHSPRIPSSNDEDTLPDEEEVDSPGSPPCSFVAALNKQLEAQQPLPENSVLRMVSEESLRHPIPKTEASAPQLPPPVSRSKGTEQEHPEHKNQGGSSPSIRYKLPSRTTEGTIPRSMNSVIVKRESGEHNNLDENGNYKHEIKPTIPKRRMSKPPALVIQPNTPEVDSQNHRILPPEFNRLTEFAEFATSPHSPLVQSPLPLVLTPGLLGADSTPDWLAKSPFTRFLFPEKSSSAFLTSPNSAASRLHSENDDEPRLPSTPSLPPSPFLDSVSTPVPFWTTQPWPTPSWHCFQKGCYVRFENRSPDYHRVEELGGHNSVFAKRPDESTYGMFGLRVLDIREDRSGRDYWALIVLESTIPGQPRLYARCPIDHPFLIKHRGWSAVRPSEALARYGTPFRKLQVGDICLQSSQNKEHNFTLSPFVTPSEAFSFSSVDTSAANALSSLAKRQNSPTPPKAQHAPQPPVPPLLMPPTSQHHLQLSMPPRRRTEHVAMDGGYRSYSPNRTSATIKQENVERTPQPCTEVEQKRRNGDIDRAPKFSQPDPVTRVHSPERSTSSSSLQASYSPEFVKRSYSSDTGPAASSPDISREENAKQVAQPKKRKRKRDSSDSEEQEKKRPMNGFMLFAKKMRIELTAKHPGKDNRAISVLLGEHWKALTQEERQSFAQKAKEMADERRRINPDCWKRKRKKCKEDHVEDSNSMSPEIEPPSMSKLRYPGKTSNGIGGNRVESALPSFGNLKMSIPLENLRKQNLSITGRT